MVELEWMGHFDGDLETVIEKVSDQAREYMIFNEVSKDPQKVLENSTDFVCMLLSLHGHEDLAVIYKGMQK